jgi:hypothetical protein
MAERDQESDSRAPQSRDIYDIPESPSPERLQKSSRHPSGIHKPISKDSNGPGTANLKAPDEAFWARRLTKPPKPAQERLSSRRQWAQMTLNDVASLAPLAKRNTKFASMLLLLRSLT